MTCSAQGLHRRSVRAQLCSLLSMLFLNMKHDATDRFMRATIGCYGAERFFLLHHTLQDNRPQVSWNTIVRMFRSWSSALEKRRVPTMNADDPGCVERFALLLETLSNSHVQASVMVQAGATRRRSWHKPTARPEPEPSGCYAGSRTCQKGSRRADQAQGSGRSQPTSRCARRP